jgi:organic hydroperoxide reductase OsmC/OhrA
MEDQTMSAYSATIEWQLAGEFRYETYSRSHSIDFGRGIRLAGNAAADNIPKTVVAAAGVDPEQQFVASLASCHMLWFLHLANRKNFVVTRYVDEASGVLGKNAEGRDAMTRVTLRPSVTFSGIPPSAEDHMNLHEKAHERCFIANSVKSEVILEPRIA